MGAIASTSTARANTTVLAGPALLLAGALGFQLIGGLAPCELCLWQRWPHLAAIALGLAALLARGAVRRLLVALAAVSILTSAGIALTHVGVEQGWWQGPTTCSSTELPSGDFASAMLAAPIVRCDAVAWQLAGISMAGWNAIASLALGAIALLWLARAR